jgi:DNA-binding protein HU-beta
MAMSTLDLADRIAGVQSLPKTQAKAIVEEILKGIAEAATQGQEVSLNGFGKFKVQSKPEREGRNPSTGEVITIAASKKLVFQPAKALKDVMNS